MSEYPNDSRGEMMMTYLPDYYQNSRVIRSIMETEGVEFNALGKALELILPQFFIETADDFGLKIWETELGLSTYPTMSKQNPYIVERRQRIISKLKGYGTTTVEVLKKVAESYDKGEIEVIEDCPHYVIKVRFVNPDGIPANLLELTKTLRDITPAHLDIQFLKNNFFIWDELDAKNWLWNQLDDLELTWNLLEVYE
jgi:hypothetical protein